MVLFPNVPCGPVPCTLWSPPCPPTPPNSPAPASIPSAHSSKRSTKPNPPAKNAAAPSPSSTPPTRALLTMKSRLMKNANNAKRAMPQSRNPSPPPTTHPRCPLSPHLFHQPHPIHLCSLRHPNHPSSHPTSQPHPTSFLPHPIPHSLPPNITPARAGRPEVHFSQTCYDLAAQSKRVPIALPLLHSLLNAEGSATRDKPARRRHTVAISRSMSF